MPVILDSREAHPFLPSLDSGAAIGRARAARQDIRPLDIAILNLMADKVSTERQLALWLGSTPLQVRLTFVATDSYAEKIEAGYQSKNTDPGHIRKFYAPFSTVKKRRFDGLIVTGVNALKDRVEQEAYWPEVQQILDWSDQNVFSSLFLCWGAKAALKHFHDIDSIKGKRKLFGLFEHELVSDSTNLLFGFPDRFKVPVSRWKTPELAAIEACEHLEIAALSREAGANILVEAGEGKSDLYPRRVYVLNHPEYETETLRAEYQRDRRKNPRTPKPKHYFPGNDPDRKPINDWRHTAILYTNWVRLTYEATPFDKARIRPPAP